MGYRARRWACSRPRVRQPCCMLRATDGRTSLGQSATRQSQHGYDPGCTWLSSGSARTGDTGRAFERAGGFSTSSQDWSASLAGAARPIQPSATATIGLTDAQRRLRNLGHYRGALDGLMGPGTRNAIRTFERDRGLPETGELSGRTADALLAIP